MNKLTIPLCLIAAATLAACGTPQVRSERSDRSEPAYAASTDATPLRPGSGRVAYLVDPRGPVNGISTQRITLHMTDGSTQVLDRRGQQVALGEHVRLRQDDTLRRDPLSFKAAD
jgi:hypothetical protein